MTIERAFDWLVLVNPGIWMILAGCAAPFLRDPVSRGLALVGGPAVALVSLVLAPDWGLDLAATEFLGLRLVLYRVDSLSFVFALAFGVAGVLQGIFSLHRTAPMQDSAGLLYAGAAMAATLVGDLFSLFLFWEVTALASAVLVLARRTSGAGHAAMRYLVAQLASGLLLLAGAITIYVESGASSFTGIAGFAAPPVVGAISLDQPGAWCVFAAFGLKAAFPLAHVWLTDAYPRASETGAVVMSAFTTKLAVYALARCFAGEQALVWTGAVMAVFPVVFAVIENDIRKVIAWSLIAQVGMMVCAVGIGSQLALNGAAAHAFASCIYQSLLFMGAGAVLFRTGETSGAALGGLHRTMPYTTLFMIVGAVSLAALPLTSGFAAKSFTLSAAEYAGPTIVWLMLMFGSAGAILHGGLKAPYMAFFGTDSGLRPKEAPFNMLLAMGAAAFLSIWTGADPSWLYSLLPYPELANEYLAQDLWTSRHIVSQLQLIAFGALAFFLIRQRRLSPVERPGIVLDVDWLWRKGAPRLAAVAGPLLSRAGSSLRGAIQAAGGGVLWQIREALSPARGLSKRLPLDATAVLSVCILVLVLVVSDLAAK
jgi:multicomponent Na+:H+ antiporter subunit D